MTREASKTAWHQRVRIPADVQWARGVSDCLSGGAEAEISAATRLLAEIARLTAMFPDAATGLIADADATTIREALASETFNERMANVRSAIRTTTENITSRYDQIRQQCVVDLEEAKARLEAMPEWMKITPEDQNELGQRMTALDVPDEPVKGREVADLQVLLARRASFPSRLAALADEVRKPSRRPFHPRKWRKVRKSRSSRLFRSTNWIRLSCSRAESSWTSGSKLFGSVLGRFLDENKQIRITRDAVPHGVR